MRRKQRLILTGAVLGGGITLIFDIIRQWLESRDNNTQVTLNTFDYKTAFTNVLIGAGIGGSAGYVYYHLVQEAENKTEFDPDEYLHQVLRLEDLKSNFLLYNELLSKRAQIKQSLAQIFKEQLVSSPLDAGSFLKQTAIGSNYDFDIILPMRKTAYSTLQEMFDDVYTRISRKFGNSAIIIKQSKAIGIKLNGYEDNDVYFDIVPGREIDDFLSDGKLNLFKNPKWFWECGSSFKIDISKNRSSYSNRMKKAIKLIKIYRDKNNMNIPSVIIEETASDWFLNNGTSLSDSENFLDCIEHLAYKLDLKRFSDPANSNNNLNKKLSSDNRDFIIDQILRDVEQANENERFIKEMFE